MRIQEPYRRTWAAIDLDAIHANLSSFRKYVDADKEIMAVVKANAYGHGAVQVAQEALASGASWLGVALLEEAIELRQAGITAPILQFGYCSEESVPVAQEYQITISVNEVEVLEQLLPYVKNDLPALTFHLKLDTGMSRLGITNTNDLHRFIQMYQQAKKNNAHIYWQGVYTHFATADEADETYAQRQQNVFEQWVAIINREKISLDYVHASNSAGTIKFPHLKTTNLVRVGISMYGLYPSPDMQEHFPFKLKQAFSLHTSISLVKKVAPHTGISYGLTYQTERDEWIGTVPIGYADGWNRRLSNLAEGLIQGQRVNVVGRICMDQCMLRLDRSYSRGEVVTLIGKQGAEEISIDEIARKLETINYEIPCMISSRVPRIYYKSGERLHT